MADSVSGIVSEICITQYKQYADGYMPEGINELWGVCVNWFMEHK